LLGSIPFGLLITRTAGLGDIRKIGSGSIGATNVLRTGRKELAVATLLLDALKGVFAVLIGADVAGTLGVLACGLAAVIGHLFPVWLGFRGGKGVATGLGVLLAASPLAAVGCGAIWLAVAYLTKISSASSLSATLAAPVLVWLVGGDTNLIILAVVVAVLLWAKHHANIRRLLAGTEPRIGT
jgi:glycerol-3-phosphate acyltransferase PlsY